MKKSLVVLIVVIMVLSLVACGGNSTPSTSSKTNVQEKETPAPTAEEKKETAPAPAEKVKIVIWGLNPIAVGSGNKEMLDAFKASHDNIVLDPQTTPGSNGYATQDVTKLLASIAGGTPPDVTTLDRFTAAQFAARNALTPIDEYIEATKLDLNSYYKFAVDEITFNNKIWALPSDMGARLLYWNKDLFKKAGLDPEKPPENWDELLDYSKKLTVTDAKGNIKQVGFIPNFGNSWLYMFGFQNGGEFLSSDGKKALLNSPEIVEALDFMVKGYDINGGAKKINAYASTFQSEANDPFVTGQLAMVINNIGVMNTVARFAPDLNFGAALPPAPAGKEKITWAGGWSWAIPKGAKHPKEAFDVIRWLSTDGLVSLEAGKKAYNKSLGRPYVPGSYPYKPMNEKFIEENMKELNEVNPNLAAAFKTYLDSMDVAKYRPVSPVGEILWTEHARAIDKAIYHEMTPQEALDAGNKIVQEQLDLFWADFKPAE